MERGRYNVGNSQMGKGCITCGASKKRSLPRAIEEEKEREQVTCPSALSFFVKGESIILSSLFVILKYVKAPSIRLYSVPQPEVSIAFIVRS